MNEPVGGLALGLTLHQIGVKFIVFEAVQNLRPLGVGISVQPNAVRELFDLGLTEADLNTVGVQTQEWALVGLNGNDIYSEPRGRLAGYNWPQYSAHRGKLQMLLYSTLVDRAGPDAVRLGQRVTGYTINRDHTVTAEVRHADGTDHHETGTLLIGSDGLHSAVRAQMHPDQPPIQWGGAIMWRGTSAGIPVRTGSSFVGLGTHQHRLVLYPISPADPDTGLATINWIAEVTVDNSEGWTSGDWNKKASLSDFIHYFQDWQHEWMDVPALLSGAREIYEYPMIDRDPVPTWQDGPVALLGDAAHVMYPTGSNGASQAIVDGRVLGARLVEHGVTPKAVSAYNDTLCAPISELVLRNRGAGPFGLLNMVNDRCGGMFDRIDDVLSPQERAAFIAGYKSAAGLAIEGLNAAVATVPARARVA
jgi:2-polyprenyl-6-methoxyphenol hydroxylase-like FAD-dependent oxidoreductase